MSGHEVELARTIAATFIDWPFERTLFESHLFVALKELVAGYDKIPIHEVLSGAERCSFSNAVTRSDWMAFMAALLDLRQRLSASLDPPPAYPSSSKVSTSKHGDDHFSQLNDDALVAKIAAVLSTRPTFASAKQYFLRVQHSQKMPGGSWASSDFVHRSAGSLGLGKGVNPLVDLANKVNDVCTSWRFGIILTEATYRMLSPDPLSSIAILRQFLVERPIDVPSQSMWFISAGLVNSTLEAVDEFLRQDHHDIGEVILGERVEGLLGRLSTLEIQWVAGFMSENTVDRTRHRRIYMVNELVSLRLALLQRLPRLAHGRVDLLT